MPSDINRPISDLLRDPQRDTSSSRRDRDDTNSMDDVGSVITCATDIFARQIFLRYPTVTMLHQLDTRTLENLADISFVSAAELLRVVNSRVSQLVGSGQRRVA